MVAKKCRLTWRFWRGIHEWDHGQGGYTCQTCLRCGLHRSWTWAGGTGLTFDRSKCIWAKSHDEGAYRASR